MKKILSFILVVCIVSSILGMFTISVSATTYTGSCGDNVTYTLDTETGVLTISGTGAMKDYSWSINAPWYTERSYITSATISDGVTNIGNYAFYNCSSLTSVTIPDSVTSIGSSVFEGCSSITSVTIPDSVTSIKNYAFKGCSSLTSVTISDSVTSISYCAFYNCSNLTSVTVPDSVTSIGDYAFYNCSNLTSVTISDSVTSIGSYAFDDCSSLTDVYYNGTEEDWNNISIGSNNEELTNATLHVKEIVTVTIDGEEVETYGSIVLGTDNGDGTYALPANVVGYYIDDKFVDAGEYEVVGGEVIVTVYFNVTMVNGAQVRYGGGLDENGKITSGNGLRFLAQVDRSSFDADSYGMKLTAEGSNAETIVDAEKWQDDTTFTVALTDMAESNYIRKFTATPFAKVVYDDGTEKTIYGTGTVTRSIYQVASGLLKDETQVAYGLSDVLNAYANQTGIRLVVKDGELKANTSYTKNGAYELEENELHFAVSDAAYDSAGNAYSVILTAQGNAQIITDNDFWYEYIRINNNNSLVKDKVTVERIEGTTNAVKVIFRADGLIERPADKNDNTTKDPADDKFDGESEWN